MLKTGDYLIYKRDVCKIKDIKEKSFNGNDYYVLEPIDDKSLTINVPVDNKNGYIRSIISKKEIEQLIERIPEINWIETDDKLIESTYKELLNSMKHEDLIKIIKTSYLRNEKRKINNKKTGEKDNTYFHLAERILYNELSISLNMSYEDTKKYVISKVKELSD